MATVEQKIVTTDIVILTCARLDLFKRTLDHITERTSTLYRLHVLDDASGYTPYLEGLLRDGKIQSLGSRAKRAGIAANLRILKDVTTSDIIVYVDDDILCPKLEPDWLERGLTEMVNRPWLGLLALNNPQSNVGGDARHIIYPGKVVTTCRNVGGTFLFIRRALLGKIGASDKERHPVKAMCLAAAKLGYDVGYLTNVYCQHIGAVSVRRKRDYTEDLQKVYPINNDTLEAPDAYKG